MDIVIEARNLTKFYGELKAVDGMHFQIQQGECFGILGPNGAGKTTAMKMLYGSSPMTDGELFILGMNSKKNLKKIKGQIGVVSQQNGLDPDFTVLDNLLVYARYFGLDAKKSLTKARELLRFMHLEEYDNRSVETLSGGMKRRLAIARALLSNPKILFLDEPTTGLDPQARVWIWEALEDLKRKGVTLVVTTHYMEEAEQICDRLLIVDKGKVLCEGTPEELILKKVGREVVEFRVELVDVDYHLRKIREKFEYQLLNNRIRLFVPEGMEGREAVHLIASENIIVRRASLDDVFLKLAGYDLRPEQ